MKEKVELAIGWRQDTFDKCAGRRPLCGSRKHESGEARRRSSFVRANVEDSTRSKFLRCSWGFWARTYN